VTKTLHECLPRPTPAAGRGTQRRSQPAVRAVEVWAEGGDARRVGVRGGTHVLRPGGGLMTLEEVAEYLAVTPRWVYDNYGQLGMSALRIGRGLRFRSDELEAWLDTRTLS
jgi:excisionase family DNA binding protein